MCCGKNKPLEEYYKHSEMADRHLNKCKECCKAQAKANRSAVKDKEYYRSSPKKYLSHKYQDIKNRCTGKNKTSWGKYEGLEFLTKEEWEQWTEETMPTFIALFQGWQNSGYQRVYAPSIDRIDHTKGYVIGNLQWLTLSSNVIKARKVERSKVKKGENYG